MDEHEAVQRMKAGDIGGLEVMVACHQLRAVRAAWLITGDLASAEDIVQDTFIQAYQRIHQFDGSKPFAPWFMRSVINAALKSTRHNAPQWQGTQTDDESWFERLFAQGPSPEQQVEWLAFQQQIRTALLRLSPRQRAVIVRKYYLEMSEQEMSSDLQIAPGTVKWLLNTARERLRRLLKGAQHD